MMKKLIIIIVLLFSTGAAYSDLLPDLNLSVPPVAEGNALAELGYLDVQLFGADPTGSSDSSSEIILAGVYAREYDMVLYFTHQSNGSRGVYKTSSRLSIMMRDVTTTGVSGGTAIMGQVIDGVRPLIFLESGATGYQDSNNPMAVIELWEAPYRDSAYVDTDDPYYNDADCAFEQMFRSVDIDCNGNPGAIGIKNMGAQGATVENVTINAEGAFAGLGNLGGIGTATHDVTVNGGRYNYYIDAINYGATYNAHTTLVGCKFNNPTAAFVGSIGKVTSPIAYIGCNFQNTNNCPFNVGYMDVSGNGGWTFNDCLFDVNTTTMLNTDGNAVYIRNSYLRGASYIVDGLIVNNPSGWTWIKELSIVGLSFGNLLDGVLNSDSIISLVGNVDTTEEAIVSSLIDFHTMDESSFPTIQGDYYSVKTAGAVGNGETDDITALNNAKATALAQGLPLFFPKGQYMVSSSFILPANLKVFGCSRKNTVINPVPSWKPTSEEYVVMTEDDADGTLILTDMAIGASSRIVDEQYYFTPVHWRVGRNSRLRDVVAIKANPFSSSNDLKTNRFKVSGHGGGRWYGALSWSVYGSSTLRGLYITGTDEPMWIYPFNNQQAPPDVNLEIINSSNKVLYHMSQEECITDLRVTSSDNIYISTAWKNNRTTTPTGRGHYEFLNCTNALMTMGGCNKWTGTDGNNRLYEVYGGSTYILNDTNIAVYKRGTASYIELSGAVVDNPSGTVNTSRLSESDFNDGETIIITLLNTTWATLSDAIKLSIIAGFVGPSAWNTMISGMAATAVTQTGSATLEIVFPGPLDLSSTGIIVITIPASATNAGTAIDAGTIVITNEQAQKFANVTTFLKGAPVTLYDAGAPITTSR